jgi:hypothetical protein
MKKTLLRIDLLVYIIFYFKSVFLQCELSVTKEQDEWRKNAGCLFTPEIAALLMSYFSALYLLYFFQILAL